MTLGEDPGDPVFTISDLLPHLAQKEVTKTVAEAFDAEKLNIILGHSPLPAPEGEAGDEKKEAKDPVRANILALLNRKYGIREEDLMSAELQAVPAGPARYVGLDEALIGGYGQDDRVCVFTALAALLDAADPDRANCLIFWDKEEIGSEGSTGAQGRFLEYCMEDLVEAWEPGAKVRDVFQNSTAVSGDVIPTGRNCTKSSTPRSSGMAPPSASSRARAASTARTTPIPNTSAGCAAC